MARQTKSKGTQAPIRGYDNWTVGEMQKKLVRRSVDELRSLLSYEKGSKSRKGAIDAIQRALEHVGGGSGGSKRSGSGGGSKSAVRGRGSVSTGEGETEQGESVKQETQGRTGGKRKGTVARFVESVGRRVTEVLGMPSPMGEFDRIVLMERLSEFLEHERGGIKLYELGLEKVDDEEQRDRIEEFLEQTRRHEEILTSMIRELGGDPQELSESAELDKQKAEALLEADADGEVGLLNYFQNLFIAEVIDHMNWKFLSNCMGSIDDEEVKAVLEKYVPDVEDEEDEHYKWAQKQLETCSLAMLFPEPEEESASMGEAEEGAGEEEEESAEIEEEDVAEEEEEGDDEGESDAA